MRPTTNLNLGAVMDWSPLLAYLVLPALLIWFHGVEQQPISIGTFIMVSLWFLIPVGQMLHHQIKRDLANTRIFNCHLEMRRIENHES